ncbi:uncharacterized protein [Coffea arabica]|uniref:Uncharacterized protein isoform X1 n=2 Tax=Coffea arabica TaxID=13443 RepID=A0ABM4V6N0_COFAR
MVMLLLRFELCFAGEKMFKATSVCQAHGAETEKSLTHDLHASNDEKGLVDGESVVIDAFRWSRCKNILHETKMISIGIPLPLEHVEVLADNLEWEDINWTSTGVVIAGKEYHLARARFMSPN